MEPFRIKGKIIYQDLGQGFWGIVDEDNKKWRPVNMPDRLKKEGLEAELLVEESPEQVSVFMWGKAVNIIETDIEE